MVKTRRLAVAAAAALALVAAVGKPAAATEIKFAIEMFQGDNPEYNALMRFKKYVEFRSNGEITVRLFPGNQMGSARDTTEMVQQGTLEMTFPSDGSFAGFYKPIEVWSIPYLFTSAPVAWAVMNSDFATAMKADIEAKTGIHVFAFSENGFRSFTNNVREIKTPADMKGLKIRTMESPVYMKMVEALGASPTPIAGSEAVMAIKQGVVDGEENPPSVVYTGGMGDVQKYYTLNEHVLGLHLIVANAAWFKSLPPGQRRIITDGANLMAWTENLQKTEGDWKYVELLQKEKGMKIHVSTPEEKDLFKKATQAPVEAYIRDQVGAELVQSLTVAVNKAEQTLYGTK